MKQANLRLVVTLLILTLTGPLPVVAQEAEQAAESDHQSHHGHDPVPVLEEGQSWETDAPLREAMLRIRDGVTADTIAFHDGILSSPGANALASTVETEVQFMITHCQLAPEPDAALHVLIGRMLAAATALRIEPESEDGLPHLKAVLHDYGATFDHPGWEPVED